MCRGTGFRRIDRNFVTRCSCRVAAARASPAQSVLSEIPRGTRRAALESLRVDTPERAHLVNSLDEMMSVRPRLDLYFCGPTGTGKTYCAVAIARELSPAGFLFALAEDIGVHLRYPSAEKVSKIVTPAVLVVDDLGADARNDSQRRALTRIYEARHNADRRTITTSNLTFEQLAVHFRDERLMSRIRGVAEVFTFTGRDRRRRKP